MKTYNEAKKNTIATCKHYAAEVTQGCKDIGLARAHALALHAKYETDFKEARAATTTICREALEAGGLDNKAATDLCRNAVKVETLGLLVATIGLSEAIFYAVNVNDAKKAALVINEENLDEVNALTLTSRGLLTKASKEYLGLIAGPVEPVEPVETDEDGDEDGDKDGDESEKSPEDLLNTAIIQLTNAEHAIAKLWEHDAQLVKAKEEFKAVASRLGFLKK